MAALAAGCSKTAEAPKPKSEEVARIEAFKAMGPLKAAESVAQLGYDFERPLMAFAGLDAKLGGEQAANDALVGLYRKYKALMVPVGQAPPQVIKASYEAHIVDGFSGLSSTYMVAGMMVAGAGTSDNGKASADAAGVQVSIEVADDHIVVTTETNAEDHGLSGKVTSKAVADLCPAPDGQVHMSFVVDSSMTDGAGSGANTKVSVELNRYFDDDAKIGGDPDYEGNVQQSAFDKGKGGYVDYTLKAGGETGSSKVNSRSPEATDAHVKAAEYYVRTTAAMAGMMLDLAAQKHVDSGRCIDLKYDTDPAKRSGAEPKTDYTITAMPRAKKDGAVAAGMVTAQQIGSGKLQNPGQKVRADAQFHYTGPERKDDYGKVSLESRSKRGVGKALVEFNTSVGGWRATVGAAYWPAGVICDPTKPFTFSGEGTTIVFTPSDAASGTFTQQTRLGYLNLDGGGTYTLSVDKEAKTGTLTAKGQMNMVVPGAGSKRAPLNAAYPLEPAPGACN